jgi:cysteinyl-tRNA synthetase
LSTHYRDPLDWTPDRLHQARQTLDRFYRALAVPGQGTGIKDRVDDAVLAALDDDLNVPLALTQMHELAGMINRARDEAERGRLQTALAACGNLLGIATGSPSAWLRGDVIRNEDIDRRIEERALARKERRFADADRIRADLLSEGIVLEDKPDGTTEWRRA